MDTNQITQVRLQELVNYAADTGIFTWNKSRRRCRLNDKTGCLMKNGYICIRLDGILYSAHRLAWLYVHGVWPKHQIDHINGDRADNRICNLREATNAQNAQNRKRKNNTSGFPGVRAENKKWLAEIKVNYKVIRLGLYNTPQEAHESYLKAKQNLHPFSQH